MAKTDLVPCFYKEQDDTWEKPMKVLTRAEVREMKTKGLGKFENNGKSFRLLASRPVQLARSGPDHPAKIGTVESDCCISFSEMQANVGIVDDGVRNPRAVIRMAQGKVRWYQHISSYPMLARGAWQLQSA